MQARYYFIGLLLISGMFLFSQSNVFTTKDTLLGSNTKYRDWWDVTHYDISVKPEFISKSISGKVQISYTVLKETEKSTLQIDLQEPLLIDSVFIDSNIFTDYKKQENQYFLSIQNQQKNTSHTILIYYHGKPKVAKNAPWDGGWVWKKDSLGNPWMSVACQGAGASIWFPCKDIQSDEPDFGCKLQITVPDSLVGIGNGVLIQKRQNQNHFTTYVWQITNTINSYDIIPYIGKYIELQDSVIGENGILKTNYWVLSHHKAQAIKHLKPNVINTLKCLEHWFGPYPFYNDSYKIVEAPYLGMEHQSNIAYGNGFLNGYYGRDLSKSGWGLKWDFIVVHETAHEWFGNSVTAKDVADNWIHEGFASYSEVLMTECESGKDAGNAYCQGVRNEIKNDIPLIGMYNVRREGSDDIYNKGSNTLHMIRILMNDDEKFRQLLRNISKTFYHKIITTAELESFISNQTGLSLKPFFDQYLRTTQIPKLNYYIKGNTLTYRYTNCLQSFDMPITIMADKEYVLKPNTTWQTLTIKTKTISLYQNVYITLEKRAF